MDYFRTCPCLRKRPQTGRAKSAGAVIKENEMKNVPGFTTEVALYACRGSSKLVSNGHTAGTGISIAEVLPQRVVARYQREGMHCMVIEDEDRMMSYEVCVDAISGAG